MFILQGHILTGLKSRFKEFRRTPRNMVRIKVPTANKGCSSSSCKNEGEDLVSHERHIKAMAAEYRKVKPSEHVVTELMKLTFHRRREQILEKATLVSELLLKFPFFHHYEQVYIIHNNCE